MDWGKVDEGLALKPQLRVQAMNIQPTAPYFILETQELINKTHEGYALIRCLWSASLYKMHFIL